MVTTCFFCQSLLSDFEEQLLPATRHEEIKRHVESCKQCAAVLKDLRLTLQMAQALPSAPWNHETALRITEACQAGKRGLSRAQVSRWALVGLVPLLVFGSAVALFPGHFPWFANMRVVMPQVEFVRYFPMLEGAADIIEEQGNWLHVREPAMRSLWEEGGISPEEFEKSFTSRPLIGEEPN